MRGMMGTCWQPFDAVNATLMSQESRNDLGSLHIRSAPSEPYPILISILAYFKGLPSFQN